MLVLSVASSLLNWPIWPAAALSWFATLRLGRQLPRTSRRQALLLGGAGVGFWVVALFHDTPHSLLSALVINQTLLMMFAGISFLSLATPSDTSVSSSRRQQGSLLGTLFGVHLFGAVINMSALFLFGDRMQRRGQLDRQQMIVLGRAFPAAAAWSPFFVAMGVALTYAPGLDFLTLLPWGLAAAFLLLGLVAMDAYRVGGDFIGFPLQVNALVLPCTLAVSVVLIHHWWPGLSIPLIISIISPLFAILLMPGNDRLSRLRDQCNEGLPRLAPQFALFLAAGVLSSGLAAMLASWPGGPDLPFSRFGEWHAWLLLGLIVALAFVGIHPLVGVTTLAPLLSPLSPDPTLLGMMFLMGWALGTGSSPLSGSNLALSVRYGVKAKDIMRWNLPYALIGWLLCGVVFAAHNWLT
ncbi:hypothetical protein [Modicisalibacter xianhensis]|uniref:Na+/H+ antiporter NhaD/arsenite permease-like protein n=1 Tax=Modicisalibacter xianhensis TaxID=442341 RepID=A0A1I3CDH8_9GAMM|nr:hypothetical protein [Halomonas xianhensis]SFH72443.1 hypothetical protein SAMN04487959_108149 [Halomonas xianhensis]